MKQRSHHLWAIVLLATGACNQAAPITHNGNISALPGTLVVCSGECTERTAGIWTFHGRQGEAKWPDGALAQLNVDRFDAGGVVIHRTDMPNSSSPGLTALYTGNLHDNRVDGTVVWSWGNRKTTGTWTATVQTMADRERQAEMARQAQAPMTPEQQAQTRQMQAEQSAMFMNMVGAMMSGMPTDDSGSTGGGGFAGGSSGQDDEAAFQRSERQMRNNEYREQSGAPGPAY